MPFKRVFERQVNRNMQGDEQGPAPRNDEVEEANIKKMHDDSKVPDHEETDEEMSEKKDQPPRFSTLFSGTPPPQVVERIIEPKRRSGVRIPTPLFVVLAFVLFFESTLLFAYTIIGLYNNLPAGVLPFGGPSVAAVGGCDCAQKQPGINIAPNFIMPMGSGEAMTFDPGMAQLTNVGPTTNTISISSSSSSSSTQDSDAAASDVLSILSKVLPTTTTSSTTSVAISTKIVTPTKEQSTVLSTVESTVFVGQPTLTSTKIVPRASEETGHVENGDTPDVSW